MRFTRLALSGYCLTTIFSISAFAQGTAADYRRAAELKDKTLALVADLPDAATWIDGTSRFWYRKAVKGGAQFFVVDAKYPAVKMPLFDHEKLAAALSKLDGEPRTALNLPFATFTLGPDQNLQFQSAEYRYRCSIVDYTCQKTNFNDRNAQGGRADQPVASPDGKWEALIRNYNVFLRPKGNDKAAVPLSYDGSEGNAYTAGFLVWAPDSQKLAAYRVLPGYHRKIQYVQSTPPDQEQPKYITREYPKPGDAVDVPQPVLFDVARRKQTIVKNALFPNPYSISRAAWRKDSRAFTFEYNQRGHQAFSLIEVDASNGVARAIVDEEAKTYFHYYSKKYRFDVNDGREVIWASERDGWNHLYLYDGVSGRVKNQITKGEWVVRGVDKVDEKNRQIWFRAGGMTAGIDPYYTHLYRVNFDGTGLKAFTEGNATHATSFSSDGTYFVDTYSRIDTPPVSVLRRVADGGTVAEIERGDIAALKASGWHAPDVFVAKGRDGATDIWGIIHKPSNFNPAKKYPVIEYIYAGPHDSFVPKTFRAYDAMQSLAEIGFVVVQIDGMGTSNRSKAFHDVSWKNLADAGFPDRILWHKAAAAKFAWYDISKVGIYGHSAGGQNSLAALLFHPEFYKVAVSSCGCHDNRMDKISWNEQFMSWPLGPEYIACSNAENASKLQGKLLLSVGELDTNVDPASTMQVVAALIKANKTFDLIVLPNTGHSTGGVYGDRKRYDFFVHHILGVEPPDWNKQGEILGSLADR
ncbi:MAG: DPP IV N-terminal domain-containing protein [Bryobacteraceae bacterium]